MTAVIISNEEIKDIMKRFEFLKKLGLFTEGVSRLIENEAK